MAQFEGVGATLEEAVAHAHDKIQIHQGRDFVVSKVVNWGMQTGGFVFERKFYVVLEEDAKAPFRGDTTD